MNAGRCAASTLEAIAARCQGDRGVDENVYVEKAASDRELCGLRELRELARSERESELLVVSHVVYTLMIQWAHNL
jgi:hypothetical protein